MFTLLLPVRAILTLHDFVCFPEVVAMVTFSALERESHKTSLRALMALAPIHPTSGAATS